SASILARIKHHSTNYTHKALTNAYNYALDNSGREIYGIFDLIQFSETKNLQLIISDPSGNYQKEALKKIPAKKQQHVLWISEPHSFFAVLKECDLFIRNTTTDGDSVSIHEALFLQKPVWATQVVDRPVGVHLYTQLSEINLAASTNKSITQKSTVKQLIDLYETLT
ncbi:MAG: hypothetical protein O3A82_16955, partial [Verrucomicrobia bacterium]|nr:hypothetical protein [Verrucomicrobiota bacterium]